MNGPLASREPKRSCGTARRRRCHARTSRPRGASKELLTRRPSWLSAVTVGSSLAAAGAESPLDVAGLCAQLSRDALANGSQIVDSKGGRASGRVVVPALPSNKAIQPPGLRCHVACLRTRRANPDPAADRRRSADQGPAESIRGNET